MKKIPPTDKVIAGFGLALLLCFLWAMAGLAKQCRDQGGTLVRNWAGVPVCLK